MRRIRWSLIGVGLLIAVCAFSTSSAAQGVAAIVVTPQDALHDGDVVTITGTDFPALADVFFCEVVTVGLPSPNECATSPQGVVADGNGSFTATLTIKRWLGLERQVIDCADPSAPCGIGASAFFSPGSPTSVVTITFAAQPPTPDPFRITGTVLDAQGQPAPNSAVVNAMIVTDIWVAPPSRQSSLSGGKFAIEDVAPQTGYQMFVYGGSAGVPNQWYRPAGAPPTRASAPTISLTTETPSVDIVIHLDASGAIAGVVTAAGGAPIAGVTVSAYTPNAWASGYATTTAADGTYNLGRLPSDQPIELRFVPPVGSPFASEWFDDSPLRRTATALIIPAGQTVSANSVLSAVP